MRADRLVSILLLLQIHKQLTAKQLAERLEVSERTIYRDMDALSGIGIPVFAERGLNGGWRLLENYQTNLTGLKEAEIRALFISHSTQYLDDLGLTRTSEEARSKLLASLPSLYQESAKEVWNRIHIDTSTWRRKHKEIASFAVLKEAIWKENKINIMYQRADGKTIKRVVEPLALVAKRNHWYFIASHDGKIRNYKCSRIQSAVVTEKTFERPADFDLVHYWQSATTTFIESLPKFEVWVAVAPPTLPRLTFTDRFIQVVESKNPGEDEWFRVKLSFETEEEAIGYILGFADQIRVLEPKSLHDKILEKAEAMVKFLR